MTTQSTTTVYLARHGQTAFNLDDRLRGRADPALNDTGRAQAQALARVFADIRLTRVVASPLQRAVDTARPTAAAAGLAVEISEGLNDRDYASWTGVQRRQVEQQFGSVDAAPGVETMAALRQRVLAAFNALLTTPGGPAILLVGHDATNRALLTGLIPELEAAPQDNGCWNKLSWDGHRWQLAVLNARPGDGQRP